MIKKITWIVISATILLAIYWYFLQKSKLEITFHAEPIAYESIYKEVSATGTIYPLKMVDVGTQVSGEIVEIMVDYNDYVKKGQVLARMDVKILKSLIEEGRTNLYKTEVLLNQSERALKRTNEMFKDSLIASIEVEKAQDEFNNAKANYNIAKLQLKKNLINLGYADILSPINGVVISKNCEIGQTVAASFATPKLFSIANNLKKMKIEASVDEADIGQVKLNQKVFFTVDSYPEEEYTGVVKEIQLEPNVVQNVVTYTVIILVQNQDLKLMPGMTATLIIRTSENLPSLTVTNSALAYNPTEEDWKELKRNQYRKESLNSEVANSVWVLKGKVLKEIALETNFTNGIKTAFTGNLTTADSVLTNIVFQKEKKEGRSLLIPNREKTKKNAGTHN